MIEFYIVLLERGKILLDDIPLYWKNQILNNLEDKKILGEEVNPEILDNLSEKIEQEYTEKDIEDYLNSTNETVTLNDGVVNNDEK